MRDYIVKVDILVAPLKVVDYSLVCQLLFHYEQVLEEVDDALIDIEVIKLSNHGLLVLEVLLIGIDQCISLINDTPNVVEHLGIGMSLQICQRIIQRLVFSLFPFQLEVHVLYRLIVALQLTQNQLLIISIDKLGLDLVEVGDDFGQLFTVGLLVTSFLQQFARFFLKLINLVVKGSEHRL